MHSQGVQPYIILNIINFNSCIPGGMQLGILSSRSPNYDFNSCIPGGMQPILLFRLLHQSEFQFMHPGWDATTSTGYVRRMCRFQFMHPGWDATARFRYYLAISTIFSIYLSFPYTSISKITFFFLFFSANTPVFLCLLHIRT